MKTFFGIAAAAIVAVTGSAALAEHHFGGHDELGDLRMMVKAANLTSSQKDQLHAIMKSSFEQDKSTRDQIHALHDQLLDKLTSPGAVTVADINSIQQQIAQIRAQQDQRWAEAAIQVRSMLTSDQLHRVSQAHERIKTLKAEEKAVYENGDAMPQLDEAPSVK